MPQKKQTLAELKQVWYQKLADSGFEDIEDKKNNLESWTVSRFLTERNNGKDLLEVQQYNSSKEAYYRIAGHFLHDHKFESHKEKLIWGYHCEGISYREIVNILSSLGVKENKSRVNKVVEKLQKLMFDKNDNDET